MSELNKLCDIKQNGRDSEWEKAFLKAFSSSEVFLKNEEPFQGPDGFSYMELSTAEGEKVDKKDFLPWCAHAGVGLVVNLKKNQTPDYVFNYGMVWNYLLRGIFLNDESDNSKESLKGSKVLVHKIMEGYLPQYARENIRDFLALNKIFNCKIGLISRGEGTSYEILWYVPEGENWSDKDQKTLMEALSWFLPLNYQVGWVKTNDKSLHLEEL